MVEKTEARSSLHDDKNLALATEEENAFDELTVLQPTEDAKRSDERKAELHEDGRLPSEDDQTIALASIHQGKKFSQDDVMTGVMVERGTGRDAEGNVPPAQLASRSDEDGHREILSSDNRTSDASDSSAGIVPHLAEGPEHGGVEGGVGSGAHADGAAHAAPAEKTVVDRSEFSQLSQAGPLSGGDAGLAESGRAAPEKTETPLEVQESEAGNTTEQTSDASAVNQAPDATDLSLTGTEDQSITITTEQLLAASNDPDNDELTVTSVDGSNLPGTLTDNGDGTWTFAPEADWNGELNLSYTVSDGYKEDTANIDITLANDMADVTNVDTTTETKSETVYGDEELVGSETVDEGILSQTVDSETGDVTTVYDTETTNTYETDYTTTDSSRTTTTTTYEDGTTTSETSDWTVTDTTDGTDTRVEDVDGTRTEFDPNEAPDATDLSLTGTEDQSITITTEQLLAASNDPDNDELTVTSVDGSNLPGTLTDNGDGTWTFAPEADWNGELNLSYTVSDGYKEDTASIGLSLEAVNDAPVAVDDTALLSEDTPYSGSVSASDVEGDELVYTLDDVPEHGSLAFDDDGVYTYTPDDDYYGTDSFTYQVSDGQGGADTATVTLDVFDVADNPNFDELGSPGNDDLEGESTGHGKNAVHASDTMYGGEGDDSLSGLGEDDELYGGSGADTIDGGDGDDLIFGGDDDDVIEGWDGADNIHGDDGADIIYGDREHGGQNFAGNDVIDGGAGEDSIYGGAGDDEIRGSAGDDWLYGDAGEDLFIWDTRDGSDYIDGGSGWDMISLGKADGDTLAVDGGWTISLDDGSEYHIDPSDDGDAYLDIADDLSGTIVDDTTGEAITFEGVERIEF